MALVIRGFGKPITVNNPYLEKFVQFGDAAGEALQSGLDLGKESVKGGLNAFNPVQTYKDVKTALTPLAGEGSEAELERGKDTDRRNMEMADQIGKSFRAGRIDSKRAGELLGRLPQREAAGNESVFKAFIDGATAGAGAVGWADMANDVVNALRPTDTTKQLIDETSTRMQEMDNIRNQYNAQHGKPPIEHGHKVVGEVGDDTAKHGGEAGLGTAEGGRKIEIPPNPKVDFPGPGASSRKALTRSPFNKPLPKLQEGQEYLTTSVLQRLEGKETVGRQEVMDLLRNPRTTDREREAITESLYEMEGKKLDYKELKTRVQSKMLPLEVKNMTYMDSGPHSGVNLKSDELHPNSQYEEVVYQSPIKNTAGDQHYAADDDIMAQVEDDLNESNPEFASVGRKINKGTASEAEEDWYNSMIDEAVAENIEDGVPGYFAHVRSNRVDETKTLTDIEIQSDLFQGDIKDSLMVNPKATDLTDETKTAVDTLKSYEQNWYERIIRERLKYAAEQGMEKYRIPTGETALKIEGLSQDHGWRIELDNNFVELTPEMAKRGDVVMQRGHYYYITQSANERGDFKAISPLTLVQDYAKVKGVTPLEAAQRYRNDPRGLFSELELAGKVPDGIKGEETFSLNKNIYTRDSASARLREIDQKIKDLDAQIVKIGEENLKAGDVLGNRPKVNPLREQQRALQSEKSTITIFMNYEKRFSDYLKKLHPEMRRVKDEFGVEYFEVDVNPKEAAEVIAKAPAVKKPMAYTV